MQRTWKTTKNSTYSLMDESIRMKHWTDTMKRKEKLQKKIRGEKKFQRKHIFKMDDVDKLR